MKQEPKPEPVKIEIKLTKEADEELNRLSDLTGFTRKRIIQHAFTLFRLYVETRSQGDEWILLPNTSLDDLSGFDRIDIPGLNL